MSDNEAWIRNIHPLPNGGYKFRIYLPDPKTGKLKQITRQSRHWDVNDAKNEYHVMEHLQGNYFAIKKQKLPVIPKRYEEEVGQLYTFDQMFERAMSLKGTSFKTSYKESVITNYNRHIKDFFMGRYINAISQYMIDSWLIELNRKKKRNSSSEPLSNHTKNQIIAIMHFVFSFAYKGGHMTKLIEIERFGNSSSKDRTKRAHWKSEDWHKFLDAIDKDDVESQAFMRLAFATGARLSELRALHPIKFNFENKILTIDTNIIRQSKEEGPTAWKEDVTKGNDVRNIKLNDTVLSLVKQIIEERKKDPDYHPRKTFIFGGNKPITANAVQRNFNRIKAIAIKNYPDLDDAVSFHGIRHSVATAIATKASVVAAKDLLGHTDLKTTSAYVAKSSTDEATDILDYYTNLQVTNK